MTIFVLNKYFIHLFITPNYEWKPLLNMNIQHIHIIGNYKFIRVVQKGYFNDSSEQTEHTGNWTPHRIF